MSGNAIKGRFLCAGLLAVLLLTLVLPACTNRQVYEAIQQNQQLECQKLPGDQYDKCMEELSESYDTYQRERDELKKDGKP